MMFEDKISQKLVINGNLQKLKKQKPKGAKKITENLCVLRLCVQ